MNRTKKATRNIIVSLLGYFCVVISGFITRTAILKYMGIEMVGIGQLFSNIFMMLSYSSLGLETSIVYSLYAPLQKQDENKVRIIMDFYKKCFRYVAICIGLLTLIFLPIIPYMVKDSESIKDIYLILVLYGLTSASSYFYAYKRSIIIASQDRYLSTLFTDVSAVLKLVLQVLIISIVQDYTLYMLTNVIVVISNILVACLADRRYPYLKEKITGGLDKEEKKDLVKTTAAMIEQKLGFVVTFAADSILMSAFLGVSVVGRYSNYLIVINGLQAGIIIIFQSVTAGIGDLAISEGREKLKLSWQTLNFVGFYIHAFCAVCLVILFNPFIEMWIGAEYVFPLPVLLLIVLHFYIEGMRKPVITCKDAVGIQWNDRWKPVAEVTLNILLSLILIPICGGIEGILWAMSISMLLTSCWIEPFMFYRHGLHEPIGEYFVTYGKQVLITAIVTAVTYICARYSAGLGGQGIIAFGIQLLVCLTVPNLLLIAFFHKSEEFHNIVCIIKSLLKNVRKRGN